MGPINWKRIAFWVGLWWLVYTAPTENPFARFYEGVTDPLAADKAEPDW
jgi:hypothetical protein